MNFMRRIFFSLGVLFAIAVLSLTAMGSFPLVRNYERTRHKGGAQAWAICEDSLGRKYFGCTNGMAIFDSRDWELHGVTNGSTVRSLAMSGGNGSAIRIYAGASEEIGYFEQAAGSGKWVYTSLCHLLPESVYPFHEVWHIHIANDGSVIFQADYKLLVYKNGNITIAEAPSKISASGLFGGNLLAAVSGKGIFELDGARFRPWCTSAPISGYKICGLLPWYGNVLAVTERHGLFACSRQSAEPVTIQPLDKFLKSSRLFCAAHRDGTYAFGTVGNGVATYDAKSGKATYANSETGLQNNTVLNAEIDSDGLLWLGLDNGIAQVEIAGNHFNLTGDNTLGAGYSSCLRGNDLYLATNQGLYLVDYTGLGASHLPPQAAMLLGGQVWEVQHECGEIFACCDNGLFLVGGLNVHRIEGIGGCNDIHRVPGTDNLLASCYDGFHLLAKQGGVWVDKGRMGGYNDRSGKFLIDKQGYVWMANWLKGVYRLKPDYGGLKFVASRFIDTKAGLPSNHNADVALCGGRVLVLGESGFYRYDAKKGRLSADNLLNNTFGRLIAPRVVEAPDGELWCVSDGKIYRASIAKGTLPKIDSVSYTPIASELIAGFTDFNFISDQRVIISSQEGFYDVDLAARYNPARKDKLIIKRIVSYGDSTRVTVPLPGGELLKLPFSLNSQRFEVVMPEYRKQDAVKYSFRLDNYDDTWSDWSTVSHKEFTRLPEGRYTFRARALNEYTQEVTEQSFEFRILPPWYRTVWARIIYCLLIIGAMLCCGKLIRDYSTKASRRLAEQKEREIEEMTRAAREEALRKDAELADLRNKQLEQDVAYKTRELSSMTMSVVRKNEMLKEISDKVARLADTVPGDEARRNVRQIRQTIRQNLMHEEDRKTFAHNFDAVYGGFTKRLKDAHSGLTESELRVCCYLMMGLNSKEMASVFNISPHSVEMTRYRLRKKLLLDRSANLTEYLRAYFDN